MIKEPVYWTMRNGQKINVDDMDVNHLRNTLKMVLRSIQLAKKRAYAEFIAESTLQDSRFKFNGDIAQEMHDNAIIEEIMGDELDEWYDF